MAIKVTFCCPVCGRNVTAFRKNGQKVFFCSQECYKYARDHGMWKQNHQTKEPGDISHENVKIRIKNEIPVFSEVRPVVGRVYNAEKYLGKLPSYVVTVNGKRINIRYGECVEVKE